VIAYHREDAIEGLHGLVPRQIVAQGHKVAAVRTGVEFGLINEALVGV
jgi:hypothetical protein